MSTIKTLTLLAIIGIFGLSISGYGRQSSQPSSSQAILKRTALTRRDKVSTTNALATALSSARVPGGIATVSDCSEDVEYVFSSSGPTLGDVLRTITSTNPQYEWTVRQGVVNVVPTSGDPALLRFRLNNLDVINAPSIDEAANQVVSAPEVRRRIVALKLGRGFSRLGMSDLKRLAGGSDRSEKRYTLKLANVTVREALNAIARAHGKAVWKYRERHCKGKAEFEIQFLVR